jgi:hypothetical protein
VVAAAGEPVGSAADGRVFGAQPAYADSKWV